MAPLYMKLNPSFYNYFSTHRPKANPRKGPSKL